MIKVGGRGQPDILTLLWQQTVLIGKYLGYSSNEGALNGKNMFLLEVQQLTQWYNFIAAVKINAEGKIPGLQLTPYGHDTWGQSP